MVDKIDSHLFPTQETNRSQNSRPNGEFEDLLGRALKTSAGNEVSRPNKPSGLSAPVLTPPAACTPQTLSQTEGALGLMDRLSQALADPTVTPRQMAPLIEALDQEAEAILAAVQGLPPEDRSKSILNETALLAKVQVAKFRRGDFI